MRHAVRNALADLGRLLKIVGKPRWATPFLIAVGFVATFAETLGITLIVLFVYVATGQTEAIATTSGPISQLAEATLAYLGSSAALAGLIFALILARAALSFMHAIVSARVGEDINARTRELVHRQMLEVSYGFIQQHEQSRLMEVLGSESWSVALAYRAWTKLVVNILSIGVFILALALISWKITIVALIGSTIITLLLRRLSEPARRTGAQSRASHQSLAELMLMTLQSMRTLRAYGHEAQHQQRFERFSEQTKISALKMALMSAWIGPVTEVGYLAILCVIIFGSPLWDVGFPATLGAVALMYRLQPHARDWESNLLSLAQIGPQLQSLHQMISLDAGHYPPPAKRAFGGMRTGVQFRSVSFRYGPGAHLILDKIDFDIPCGKRTALIGASGAGKTTIINLLLRLYEPTSGQILIDGADLGSLERADWLKSVAVAGQDVDLIEGTVLDNLRLAKPDATRDEVLNASRIAAVDEFVAGLPDGYETWVGQEGLRFSGGQRQRIGLARALLRKPAFLVLDEATSALDYELEERIGTTLEREFPDVTLLIVTHRLSTIADVDHVIRIEGGKVVEERSEKVRTSA